MPIMSWLSIAVRKFKIQPSEFWGMTPFVFIRLMQDEIAERKAESGKQDITRCEYIRMKQLRKGFE